MVLRAGFYGTVGQSSAQVIDGSLKFDKDKLTHLTRTPSSSGNRNNWTISCWIKRGKIGTANQRIFESGNTAIRFGDDNFQWIDGSSGNNGENTPSVKLRDPGWYHLVFAWDSSAGVNGNKIYVNGVELPYNQTGGGNPSGNSEWNTGSQVHTIGANQGNTDRYYDGMMSQCYFVDGLTLGPGYFGFTDPLTGIWRPKKFRAEGTTVNDGTVWSSLASVSSGSFQGSFPATNGFNGTLTSSDRANGDTNGSSIDLDFSGKNIIVKNDIAIWSGKSSMRYSINGGEYVSYNDATEKWKTIPFSGKLVSLKIKHGSDSEQPGFSGLAVDGVTMLDSTTTNLDFGTNGFYLPMDGNSPIGEDKSGKGNNWTPVKFGGRSNSLDKATGGLPILNTVSGGNYATSGIRTDSNASSVIFAAPLISDATDVSNQINSGSTTKSGTLSGATSESVSNFYGKSLVFDGSNDSISYTNQSEFVMGTSDFTMECWVYVHSTDSERTVFGLKHTGGSGWTGYKFYINTSAAFIFYAEDAGSGGWDVGLSAGNNTINVNRWQHLAVTRSGNTFKIFVDGVLKNSTTSSVDLNDTGDGFYIGENGYDQQWMDGNIQDVRIYKGVAKYTSDFVPASSNPNILPDTPSGVSGSSKLAKIIDGAVSFDGSADVLDAGDSSDFELSSNYTIEFWVYPIVANQVVVANYYYTDGAAERGWHVDIAGSPKKFRFRNAGTGSDITSSTTVDTNRWYHIAVVTSSGTSQIYVNGVADGSSGSIGTPTYTLAKLTIGGLVYASESSGYGNFFNGFISNLRIVKDQALYTSNFTPPTEPLTTTSQSATSSNVKLLCCQSNTSSTDVDSFSIVNFPAPYSAVNRFGSYKEYTKVYRNATSGTTLPMSNPSHYGGKALDLSSGGFQITTVNSASEDFFMGMWVHFDSYGTSKQFGVDIAGNYVYFETLSNGAVKIRHTGDGGSSSSNTSLDDGNWHHVALSRTNDTLYGFVDGTAVVSDNGGTSGNSVAANSKFNFWGADNNFTSYNIDGQIIDAFIYIGKGVSSYTNPNAPLVGDDGTINHFSGFSDSDAYYISPCVDITGSQANSLDGFFIDKAGGSTGTASNFNPLNTDINTVRGQETGYATLNPLDGNTTLSNGNLKSTGKSGYNQCLSTIGMTSGKYYCEISLVDDTGYTAPGIALRPVNGTFLGNTSSGYLYYSYDGKKRTLGTNATYGSSFTTGDVIGVAFDADAGNLSFYKNGVSQGTAFTGLTSGPYFFAVDQYNTSNVITANFGQKPFKFSPPDGFQPLNAANVRPETVIARPDQYVGITTWSGTAATHSITGLNFNAKPDLVWLKERSSTSDNGLWNSVMGQSEYNSSNATNGHWDTTTEFTSFDHNGFTLGNSTMTNQSGQTYVAWCWRAGGSKGTFNIDDVAYPSAAAAGLDGGSLDPSGASIGTKQGFSILKYSGASGANSISHGLSQAPTFIIVKCIDGVADQNWTIYHKDLPTGDYLKFTSDEKIDYPMFNDSTPNSSTIPLGNDDQVSGSSGTYILYAWHDVPGLQKFGSYAGTSGKTFVELGFRPALLVIKFYDGTDVGSHAGWKVIDSERNKFNPDGIAQKLEWNTSRNENGGTTISTSEGKVDFLSNGFRIIDNHAPFNSSGRNYIYMAWAEQPAFNLYGGQSNAR